MGRAKTFSVSRGGCILLLCGLMGAASPSHLSQTVPGSQQTSPNTGRATVPSTSEEESMDAGMRARMQAQHERYAMDERHRRLLSDTEKLVALSAELKTDVDKTDKNQLSLDVIRKAGEIEKLAHDVKERMKN